MKSLQIWKGENVETLQNYEYEPKQDPITWSEQLPYKAYVKSFISDQFNFRHILGHFFPRR